MTCSPGRSLSHQETRQGSDNTPRNAVSLPRPRPVCRRTGQQAASEQGPDAGDSQRAEHGPSVHAVSIGRGCRHLPLGCLEGARLWAGSHRLPFTTHSTTRYGLSGPGDTANSGAIWTGTLPAPVLAGSVYPPPPSSAPTPRPQGAGLLLSFLRSALRCGCVFATV